MYKACVITVIKLLGKLLWYWNALIKSRTWCDMLQNKILIVFARNGAKGNKKHVPLCWNTFLLFQKLKEFGLPTGIASKTLVCALKFSD